MIIVSTARVIGDGWLGAARTSVTVVGRGPRQGSILEGLRVPLVHVLIAIKLLELDTLVREVAHKLDLSYNTVYDLFDLFIQPIVRTDRDTSFTLSVEIEMDES
ncbi:MAG: hypothetical protein WCF90_01725 [Methanomicrobiales archaeon]